MGDVLKMLSREGLGKMLMVFVFYSDRLLPSSESA